MKLVKFYSPLKSPKEIIIPSRFKKLIKLNGTQTDMQYSVKFFEYNSEKYFSVLSKDRDKIIAFSIDDTSKVFAFKISLPPNSTNKLNRSYFIVSNKSIYFIDCSNRNSYKYQLFSDSFNLIKIRYLSNLKNTEYSFVSTNAEILSNETLLLNYVIPRMNVFNFLDTHNLMLYDTFNNYKKVGFYPERFTEDVIQDYYTLFKPLNDSECIFSYSQQDEIFKYNFKNDKVLKQCTFREGFTYAKFDKRKIGDIGYSQLFSSLAGENLALEITNNRYYVLIKRLPKEPLELKKTKQYYIFNDDLKLVYSDTIRVETVNGPLIEAYKNGFLLLSNKLNKLYYYEIE